MPVSGCGGPILAALCSVLEVARVALLLCYSLTKLSTLHQAGVAVEVTAVDRPDIDVAEVKAPPMRHGVT